MASAHNNIVILCPVQDALCDSVSNPSKSPILKRNLCTPTIASSKTPLADGECYIVLEDHLMNDNPERNTAFVLAPWVPVLFKPTPEVRLNEVEVAVSAYIFGTDLRDYKEMLITSLYGDGSRETLKSLMPEKVVDQDVVNLVAQMLTYELRSKSDCTSTWFLPATFAEFCLSWTVHPSVAMNYFQQDFMGKVENLSRIFLPIREDDYHWYLLVIDLNKQQLILLDSIPPPPEYDGRHLSVRTLAMFVQQMLNDESFYNSINTEKPICSGFELVELIPSPNPKSDSGVWVAAWMMKNLFSNNYKIKVDDGTRMRIAVDLVLRPHNPINDCIILKAFENLQRIKKIRSDYKAD